MNKSCNENVPRRVAPVYDILNCGPRHRFVANGKLVHNSDSQNPQNLPSGRIAGQSKALRRSITAPIRHQVIACDSAQVELRVGAYVAQQLDMLQVFAENGDPYRLMASRIYGVQLADVTGAQRQIGKSTTLGCIFGIGPGRYRDYIREMAKVTLPPEECQHIVQVYRRANYKIVEFWRRCDQVLMAMITGHDGWFGGPDDRLFYYNGSRMLFGQKVPGIRLPNGLWVNYPQLRTEMVEKDGEMRQQVMYSQRKGKSFIPHYLWGGVVTENLVQALAFALMKWQGALIQQRYPIRLNTHDEHAIVVLDEEVPYAKGYIEDCMRAVPAWLAGCPINCESSVALRYGDC